MSWVQALLFPPLEPHNLMPAVAFDILGERSKGHVASLWDLTIRLHKEHSSALIR